MFEINTIDANDQLLETELDGETYFVRLSWNSEAGQWAMAIQNYNQETVVAGIAVVPNTLLLRRFHYLPLPPGELMALVLSEASGIGRDGFLKGLASLIYIPSAEIG